MCSAWASTVGGVMVLAGALVFALLIRDVLGAIAAACLLADRGNWHSSVEQLKEQTDIAAAVFVPVLALYELLLVMIGLLTSKANLRRVFEARGGLKRAAVVMTGVGSGLNVLLVGALAAAAGVTALPVALVGVLGHTCASHDHSPCINLTAIVDIDWPPDLACLNSTLLQPVCEEMETAWLPCCWVSVGLLVGVVGAAVGVGASSANLAHLRNYSTSFRSRVDSYQMQYLARPPSSSTLHPSGTSTTTLN